MLTYFYFTSNSNPLLPIIASDSYNFEYPFPFKQMLAKLISQNTISFCPQYHYRCPIYLIF